MSVTINHEKNSIINSSVNSGIVLGFPNSNTASLSVQDLSTSETYVGETVAIDSFGNGTLSTLSKFSLMDPVGSLQSLVYDILPPGPPPTYSISPSISSVNEGTAITWTITTTNIGHGTTLYWNNSGTTSASDFVENINSGSVVVYFNTATITLSITADNTTEGSETAIINLRTDSVSGPIVATATTVTINDTSITPNVEGQQVYTTPGSYTWICPAGVTSVSVLVIGAGGGGATQSAGGGGGGGALAYANNYSVTPGNSYAVQVGTGGSSNSNGTSSYFVGSGVILANGGESGSGSRSGGQPQGGWYSGGGGGGTGGSYTNGIFADGGGGAAGYTGSGGNGAGGDNSNTAGNGSGGGGGGGGGYGQTNYGGGGGGGVGIYGQGSNGSAGSSSSGGAGGSGGSSGGSGGGGAPGGSGGQYGGGGGNTHASGSGGTGGSGAVRIIYPGTTRSFPSTNVGNY